MRGQRIQGGQSFLSALTEFMKLRQRSEFRLHFLDSDHGRVGVFAGLAGHLSDCRVVLGERGRQRANLIELALDGVGHGDRLRDLGFGRPQLTAKIFEGRALSFQRVEARLRLLRLGRELLHRFAMLVQLTIGPERLLHRLFRLPGGFLQRLDPVVDEVKLLRALVQRAQPPGDVVEPSRKAGGLVGHLLQRLPNRQQSRAVRRQRGEHRAESAALFTRHRDKHFEFGGLLLNDLAVPACDVFEGIQHESLPYSRPNLCNIRAALTAGVACGRAASREMRRYSRRGFYPK